MAQPLVRALGVSDIPNLAQINPTFTSDSEMVLEKVELDAQEITWHLVCKQLEKPFEKGHGYDLDESELSRIRRRLLSSECLSLVAVDNGRIVGLLEVEPSTWRRVGWIWNILIDVDYRGHGLGRRFVERGVAWARKHDLQALVAETQTNNVPACRFYAHVGFRPAGIDDHYYRHCGNPASAHDVALFWYLDVNASE